MTTEMTSGEAKTIDYDGREWRLVTPEEAEQIEEGCTGHTMQFVVVCLHSRLGIGIAPQKVIDLFATTQEATTDA